MSSFWHDSSRGIEVTYTQLMDEIINSKSNKIIVQNENPYVVFLNILQNLSCKKTSVILDADFSENEIASLGLKMDVSSTYLPKVDSSIKDIQSFIDYLQNNKESLFIDIYTSGTTGRPKRIKQSFSNIIRSVKQSLKYKKDIWAFAYNPTHFAGLQVFFQAFFNQNPIIYTFHGDFKNIANDINNFNVSRLSCTPTFMKMLLPFLNDKELPMIKTLTFGGEKFDSNLGSQIAKIFPAARIINVYASTEGGSLLATDGEFFKIPERHIGFIKISAENHLLIHNSLLGSSDKLDLVGNWYDTGDIVEYVDAENFKIIGRCSDIINVGGYKVSPFEVEQILKTVEGVKDIIVYGRKNSVTGAIVIADVIIDPIADKNHVKHKILDTAKEMLQEWKVPRVLNFVEKFELTHTGKVRRNR